MLFTIYKTASGRIDRSGSTTRVGEEAVSLLPTPISPDESAHIGADLDADTWWVSSTGPELRPTADFTPLSGVIAENDTRTLTGLPDGAVVTVSRPEGDDLSATVAADGVMAITFAEAGAYRIAASGPFPLKTSEVEVNVEPDS